MASGTARTPLTEAERFGLQETEWYYIRGQAKHGYEEKYYEKFSTCRFAAQQMRWYRIYEPGGALCYYQETNEEGRYYDAGDCPPEGPEFWKWFDERYAE
jgi:hypothetical protein